MLHLTLIRAYRKADYTIGQLYTGNTLLCNTIEDTDRGLNQNDSTEHIKKVKVPGQTAIPTGTYKLTVSQSPKFGRRLIEVLNVPGFSGIRVHRGNTAADSAGCIIPGKNTARGRVTDSTRFEELLTQMVDNAIRSGEECYLTIVVNI